MNTRHHPARWPLIPVTVAALAVGLTACRASHGQAPGGTRAARAPTAAVSPASTCASRTHAWAHDRGLAQIRQVGRDAGHISTDAFAVVQALQSGNGASGQIAQWSADATSLETDAQAASSNPPPACADAADYTLAMQDLTSAAKDDLSAAADISSGNIQAAIPMLKGSTRTTAAGTGALRRATSVVQGMDS